MKKISMALGGFCFIVGVYGGGTESWTDANGVTWTYDYGSADNKATIIAVNKKRYETVDAVFVVNGLQKGSVELPFEYRSIDVGRGVFSDTFAPWQPHVYNIRID